MPWPMIKQVLFDIGNVLLRFDHTPAIEKIQRYARKNLEDVREDIMAVNREYESGGIDRATFLQRAFEIIQFEGEDQDFVTAWQEIFTENLAMTALAHQVSRHYPVYILSNTSDIHVDYFTREYEVFKLFKQSIYSHEAGAMKPADHIYEVAIRELGIEPSETFYIDDLPANIEAGRKFGFVCHLYDWRNHDAVLEDMRQAGLDVEAILKTQPPVSTP